MLDKNNWEENGKLIIKALPALGSAIAAIIAAIAFASDIVAVCLIVAILLGFTVWILLDKLLSESHANTYFKISEQVRDEDQRAQGSMVNGSQYVKFIQNDIGDIAEVAFRDSINNLAYRASLSILMSNHICREMADYVKFNGEVDPKKLLVNQKRIVSQAFRLSLSTAYTALLIERLPSGKTISDAVSSYVNELFKEIIGPELTDTCNRKIRIYDRVINGIEKSGRHFKLVCKEKKEKNLYYLQLIHELLEDSGIYKSHVSHRSRPHSGISTEHNDDHSSKYHLSIYQRIRQENESFLRENAILKGCCHG